MKYELEADWQLLNTCNYRCPYCFFGPEVLGSKLQATADPAAWLEAFDLTGYRWLLHITGGEPSIYPNFPELCERLTRNHYISLNSNLSNKSISDFAERVDPSRVSFINAGFHFEERERRSGNQIFLKNVELLRSNRFPVLVSLVATPRALALMDEAIELLLPTGFFPIPKLKRGVFEGKRFPDSYSALDRERFRRHAESARLHYAPILAEWAERPTLDMFTDDQHLQNEPSFLGQSCSAGNLFVRIDPYGEVFRCGTTASMGNILARTFVRYPKASRCDTNYCFYFCQKYATRPIEQAPQAAFDLPKKLFGRLRSVWR